MKKLPIKIIVIGLLAMLITACSSSAYEYRKERLVINVEVPLGEAALVANTSLSVKFDSVEQDSRCPINAKCLWAGVAIVNVTVINGEGVLKKIKLSSVNYETFNTTENVFGKNIELMAVLPNPSAGTAAKPEIIKKLIKLKID
jgi:hypothetical protein